MTLKQLQDECINMRFKEAQRSSITRWINLRYHMVWGLTDWPWKRVGPVDLAVMQGVATPTPPSGFARPIFMYDDRGDAVLWLPPDEFDSNFLFDELNESHGRPSAFKWVDNEITLGPVPDADYTFHFVYDRGMTYLQNGVSPTVGEMALPDDAPFWDSPYHYLLVTGAIAEGLRLENDPTYGLMEESFEQALMSMKDYYLPTVSTFGNLQYGRDSL